LPLDAPVAHPEVVRVSRGMAVGKVAGPPITSGPMT
jgi:hypothetical protein